MSDPASTPICAVHRPQTRHLGTVTLWPSDILNCLQLPEGAKVCYIGLKSNPQSIEIVIEHPELPEVPEMCSAPALMQKAYSEGPFEDALNKEIYWKTYVVPVIEKAEDGG